MKGLFSDALPPLGGGASIKSPFTRFEKFEKVVHKRKMSIEGKEVMWTRGPHIATTKSLNVFLLCFLIFFSFLFMFYDFVFS